MSIYRLFTTSLFVILLLTIFCGYAGGWQNDNVAKKTVGATESIHVVEAELDFDARIDTGARTTSIHAQEIQIINPALIKKENIGKEIFVLLENARGERYKLQTVIVDAAEVRNAQGVETRYMIPLTLRWQGIEKLIHVNLRDRSTMTYKLLIGRDWLSKDFVVDVDINSVTNLKNKKREP